jgi:hypothetical protein
MRLPGTKRTLSSPSQYFYNNVALASAFGSFTPSFSTLPFLHPQQLHNHQIVQIVQSFLRNTLVFTPLRNVFLLTNNTLIHQHPQSSLFTLQINPLSMISCLCSNCAGSATIVFRL